MRFELKTHGQIKVEHIKQCFHAHAVRSGEFREWNGNYRFPFLNNNRIITQKKPFPNLSKNWDAPNNKKTVRYSGTDAVVTCAKHKPHA